MRRKSHRRGALLGLAALISPPIMAMAQERSINWSERTEVRAPGGEFSLVTIPDYARDDNRTDLQLRARGAARATHILYFGRDIGVTWAWDGRTFSIVDRYGEGGSRVRLFRAELVRGHAAAREFAGVNEEILNGVGRRLPRGAKPVRVDYQVPVLSPQMAIVEVTGYYTRSANGRGTSYCFRARIGLEGAGGQVALARCAPSKS